MVGVAVSDEPAFVGEVWADECDVGHVTGPGPAVEIRTALEIACDESGSEGEKLIGGNTDVFAHAGVRLDVRAAENCMQEIRNRAPSPAEEYKANILLRGKHRSALTWLLGPSGPIFRQGHVHLIDKPFFAVRKVVDLLLDDVAASPFRDRQAAAMAVTLYRDGPRVFGRERWVGFLESFNTLVRAKNDEDVGASVDAFFGVVDTLRRDGAGDDSGIGDILERFGQARPRADSFRTRLLGDPATIPALDPLIPAIVQAVAYWGRAGRPVSIVHDRQTALTEERIAQLLRHAPRGRLAGLRLVGSAVDARIQVADLLVGTARKIAEDELNGRGDPELTALLRPYVDARSIWGDARSWSRLGPMPKYSDVPPPVDR